MSLEAGRGSVSGQGARMGDAEKSLVGWGDRHRGPAVALRAKRKETLRSILGTPQFYFGARGLEGRSGTI